jgi:hypothetical protein
MLWDMPSQGMGSMRELIGVNIDRGIRLRNMNSREVAEAVDRHTGSAIRPTEHQVWRWRNGKHTPEKATLAALVEVLFDGDFTQLYRPARNGHGEAT